MLNFVDTYPHVSLQMFSQCTDGAQVIRAWTLWKAGGHPRMHETLVQNMHITLPPSSSLVVIFSNFPSPHSDKGSKKFLCKGREGFTKSKPRRSSWHSDENGSLAKAWVSFLECSILGSKQKSEALWEKILKAFAGFKLARKGERTPTNCYFQ